MSREQMVTSVLRADILIANMGAFVAATAVTVHLLMLLLSSLPKLLEKSATPCVDAEWIVSTLLFEGKQRL